MQNVLGAASNIGYSFNSTNDRAEEAGLLIARRSIKVFADDNGQDLLASGEVDACQEWNGDIIQVAAEDKDLAYVVPTEGSLLWQDTMAIPAGAPHPKNAHAFLNFVLDAEAGKHIAETIQYATANAAAKALMDASYTGNTAIFPPPKSWQVRTRPLSRRGSRRCATKHGPASEAANRSSTRSGRRVVAPPVLRLHAPDISRNGLTNLKPPEIRADMLCGFVKSVHGIDGAWSRLDGERDQNFRIVEASGASWVFKVCNPHEAAEIVACQADLLEHIARTDPTLPVPRLRRALDGAAAPLLADSTGNPHLTLMLSWLPGAIAGGRALSGAQLKSSAPWWRAQPRHARFHPCRARRRRLVWTTASRRRRQQRRSVSSERGLARRMLSDSATAPCEAGNAAQPDRHGDIHPQHAAGR
jgi:hypothetical protein